MENKGWVLPKTDTFYEYPHKIEDDKERQKVFFKSSICAYQAYRRFVHVYTKLPRVACQ